MSRFFKAHKEFIGISPDSLIFRGEKKNDKTRLRLITYDQELLSEYELTELSEISSLCGKETVNWLNIDGVHDESIMQEIAEKLQIEPFIISEVMNTHARPKIVEHDDCIFISVKMASYNELSQKVNSENLVLILKENCIISFQERVGDVFEPVRQRIRKNKKRIRASKCDYLAFALLDIVIENYIYISSQLGDKIEALEDELTDKAPSSLAELIFDYKAEVNYMRRLVKACNEAMLMFTRIDSELLNDSVFVHLGELVYNSGFAYELLETYREMLSEQLNLYQTFAGNKLNSIMKFLTIFSVIFIPLTFVAGIYGTNFDFVPELHFKYSYFIMWGVMIGIAGIMMLFFKRKGWL